jgi:transposase
MGNVLRMDKKHVIEGMIGLGWSDRRIQRETHVHRITVAKYRRTLQNRPQVPAGFSAGKGQNDPQVPAGSEASDSPGPVDEGTLAGTDQERLPPPLPPPRNTLLVPHLPAIQAGLSRGLSAQRIYQDLVEEGRYHGSYDSIKRYIRKVRKKAPHFFERLPVFPGREAQVDFSQGPMIGEVPEKRRSWLFKMTLSFSRHAYEELIYAQDVETFLRCHEHAFAFFGGVPETVKIDNLKSGVLRAHLYEPTLNPVYLSFSQWYGFVINPCDPYQPQQKGRVERDIAYTQGNALKGRKISSLEEGNQLLLHWNKRWARLRIHGTTKRQVWSQFVEFEKPCLRPLTPSAFPFFKVGKRKVDVQGHIEVAGNFYSAPHPLIGTYVTVHFNSEEVAIFAGEKLLCRHRTRSGKAQASSLPEHRPPHKPVSLEAEEHMHLREAKRIGPNLSRFVEKILSRQDVGAIKKVRGAMSLRKAFSAVHLEEAAGLALARHNTSYHYVKSLCESLRDFEGNTQDTLTEEHEFIRALAEYQDHVNERTN